MEYIGYVITAIIIYFILQVTANLVRIWRGAGRRSPSGAFFRGRNGAEDRFMREDRESPRYWGRDVEDASWVDLEDEEETS